MKLSQDQKDNIVKSIRDEQGEEAAEDAAHILEILEDEEALARFRRIGLIIEPVEDGFIVTRVDGDTVM